MNQKRSQVLGFLTGLFLMWAVGAIAGATFSRVTTWSNGQVLTASALNAEFDNILNNLDPDGIDDFSVDTTEMRSTADPYPASSESLATSLEGELERLRYQILEIKKAIQASNVTYWYQDLPTAGMFTIATSSVGVNDTTPDYTLDVEGTFGASGNATVSGSLTAASTVTFTGMSLVIATDVTASIADSLTSSVMSFDTESVDTLSEFNGSTFTATSAGNYYACFSGTFSSEAMNVYGLILKDGSSNILAEHAVSDDGATSDIMAGSVCAAVVLSAGGKIIPHVLIDDVGNDGGTFTNSRFSVWRLP